jgi:hypothetical protein
MRVLILKMGLTWVISRCITAWHVWGKVEGHGKVCGVVTAGYPVGTCRGCHGHTCEECQGAGKRVAIWDVVIGGRNGVFQGPSSILRSHHQIHRTHSCSANAPTHLPTHQMHSSL